MRSFIPAILILTMVGVTRAQNASPPSSLPPPARRFAVLIGVEKYEDPNISSLTGPTKDVEKMKEVLIKRAGFLPDHISVLTTRKPGDAPDKSLPPTSANILEALGDLKPLIQDGDLLLIMFSGHGMEVDNEPVLLAQESRNRGNLNLFNTHRFLWRN